jgi:hypothetical protein
MELTNQFATVETNKTAAIVLELLEHFLGHKHTRVGLFHEIQKKRLGTLHDNRKNVPPVVKNKKFKKGECCGQHSGGVALLSWQDKKRVAMISKYRKAEICVAVLWLFAIMMSTWEWWI